MDRRASRDGAQQVAPLQGRTKKLVDVAQKATLQTHNLRKRKTKKGTNLKMAVRWAILQARPDSTPPASAVFSACPLGNFVLDDALVLRVDSHLPEDFAVDAVTNGEKNSNHKKGRDKLGSRVRTFHTV